MKDGGSAFPRAYDAHSWPVKDEPKGMTLRDYFAAKAMQAVEVEAATKNIQSLVLA